MIGGVDINFDNRERHGAEIIEFVVREVRRLWSDAVLVDGSTGLKLGATAEIGFRGLREVLAFRDERARESWERLGADAENQGTLIYMIAGTARVTLVVGDENDPVVSAVWSDEGGGY